MLSNLMSVFRKRRRVDADDDHIDNVVNDISKEALASYCAMESQIAQLPTLIATSTNRFVTVMDQLDARVEKFRKDALSLQENREVLLMSIELIKNNDMLQKMTETEREEISCYIQRVNARLLTVELNVRTVRDCAQEDSLSQINALIDTIIGARDPSLSRQRCQQFLNACCSAGEAGNVPSAVDVDAGPVDKKFESALLGCTLDDQKNIKKRLHALMGYLEKQHVRN